MSKNLDVLMDLAGREPLECPVDRFYFVRHGETEGNFSGFVQYPTTPLNTTGLAQAERAARVMADEAFDRIVASTFTRAWQTALALHRETGKPLTESADLVERKFGELMGRSNHDLDWLMEPAGGESVHTFIERTRAGFVEAVGGPGVAAIVAHGGNLRVLAAGLRVELPLGSVLNARPLRFERNGRGWALTLLGHETEHSIGDA